MAEVGRKRRVAQKLGYGGAGVLGQSLDHVLYHCDKHGLRPLTCIVVTPTTGLPREGYPVDEQLFRDRERVYEHNWFANKPPQTSDFEVYPEGVFDMRRKRGISLTDSSCRYGPELAGGAGMVSCKFSGLGPSAELPPVQMLCVRGAAMYADGHAEPFAVHTESHWEFQGKCYTRFDVDGPLVVRPIPVDGSSAVSFVEPRVWFADGVLHRPSGHIVCLEEDTGTWCNRATGTRYSEIVLSMRTP